MTIHKFAEKALFPVILVVLWFFLFRPLCVVRGECDYRMLFLLMGIPFGVRKMFVWIVPKKYDIGGTVGFLALQIIAGGMFGGAVMLAQLVIAGIYFIKGIFAVINWLFGQKKRVCQQNAG